MVSNARCKFQCEKGSEDGNGEIVLRAQYDYPATIPEDKSFSTATPWGTLHFRLNNPALAGFFEPGKSYYIDISPIEPPAAG